MIGLSGWQEVQRDMAGEEASTADRGHSVQYIRSHISTRIHTYSHNSPVAELGHWGHSPQSPGPAHKAPSGAWIPRFQSPTLRASFRATIKTCGERFIVSLCTSREYINSEEVHQQTRCLDTSPHLRLCMQLASTCIAPREKRGISHQCCASVTFKVSFVKCP